MRIVCGCICWNGTGETLTPWRDGDLKPESVYWLNPVTTYLHHNRLRTLLECENTKSNGTFLV